MNKIIIGTRASELALWQANFVKKELENLFPDILVELKLVSTKGDKILDKALNKIGDKGLFTKELENELLAGTIHIAVHSLKDMQTVMPEGLIIAAITKRDNPEDALIARGNAVTIESIRHGGTVATGSLRRRAQLLHFRPDLNVVDLRGNVNTRLEKFFNSDWEAVILARTGLERINKDEHISSVIPVNQMIPAVGQGALGVQISEDNPELKKMLGMINHQQSFLETSAERAFLRTLGGGCQTPIAAYAKITGDKLHIDGMVASIDGKKYFREKIISEPENFEQAGTQLAEDLLKQGADSILHL